MKIELICIEKTKKIEYKNIIQDYLKRINRKLDLTINEITFVNSKKQNMFAMKDMCRNMFL